MANLKAFKGVTYNPDKVELENVVAPPYDVISPAYKEELYLKDPYNVIRLILGKEENWYQSAASNFKSWRQSDILTREKVPTLYYLVQEFVIDGVEYRRGGFISLCELIEFSKGVVLPHEKTLSKPKADRFELMKATNANFEQIFALYYDEEKKIDKLFADTLKQSPFIDVEFEGVRNFIWKLQDEKVIQSIIDIMKDKKLYIADGHHRYETGILYRNYRKEQESNYTGKELYNYILMYVTNVDDPGLVIMPTHRGIFGLENFDYDKFKKQISDHFNWIEYTEKEAALEALKKIDSHAFMVKFQGKDKFVVIKLKNPDQIDKIITADISKIVKNLDVTLLHSYILEQVLGISKEAQAQKLNLDYEKDVDDVLDLLDDKKYQMAFILNPSKINEVTSIASEGGVMPQKSTYFFPKLYSGFIFSPFDEE
jgi:uncharacterized protein (DUF1015 family)